MMGICSVVFSELLFFDAGEFRTENLSLGEFNFFFPQVRTNRAFVIQTHRRMIWREGREEEKGGETRHPKTRHTTTFYGVTHTSISLDQKSGVTLGISNRSPPLSPCVSLHVFFFRRNRPTPNYNATACEQDVSL